MSGRSDRSGKSYRSYKSNKSYRSTLSDKADRLKRAGKPTAKIFLRGKEVHLFRGTKKKQMYPGKEGH